MKITFSVWICTLAMMSACGGVAEDEAFVESKLTPAENIAADISFCLQQTGMEQQECRAQLELGYQWCRNNANSTSCEENCRCEARLVDWTDSDERLAFLLACYADCEAAELYCYQFAKEKWEICDQTAHENYDLCREMRRRQRNAPANLVNPGE